MVTHRALIFIQQIMFMSVFTVKRPNGSEIKCLATRPFLLKKNLKKTFDCQCNPIVFMIF